MRVALVMPMVPASAIADVTLQGLPYLKRAWDVEIWRPSEQELRDAPVPVHTFDEPDDRTLDALAGYDLVVYVLGDSPWHARILTLARALPGLVVLHDASLTGLVRHAAVDRNDLAGLVDYVAATYGPREAAAIESPHESEDRAAWFRMCVDVPLDDYVVEGSLGVVVHSRWHASRLDGRTLGAVTVADLPVPVGGAADSVGPGGEDVAALLAALPDDDVLLVTIGSVNPNRHIDLLLEAVASEPALASRVHVWAVGHAEASDADELLARAEEVGLADRFVITGWVGDAALAAVLARADAAAALRDPVLEGQSASVLTQMLAGVPVVVYDHAHYAELPSDAVVKVAPDGGVPALAKALRDAVAGRHAGTGERARQYVLETRSARRYAGAIVEAGERALGARAHVTLAYRLAERLQRLGLHDDEEVLGRVVEHSFELYDLG